MIADNSQLALDVHVSHTQLDVVIKNEAPEQVRVWARSNSWGWYTLALEVAGPPPSEDYYALTVKPRAFTRNGPGFVEIPVGGTHVVTVTAGDPEWDGIDRLRHLRREPLRVRARFQVPPSPEAETHGVFVGEVSSPWQESQPPHPWLFADN